MRRGLEPAAAACSPVAVELLEPGAPRTHVALELPSFLCDEVEADLLRLGLAHPELGLHALALVVERVVQVERLVLTALGGRSLACSHDPC